MKKRSIFLIIVSVFFLSACLTEEYTLCPDNITKVIDIADCPIQRPQCPICDENKTCIVGRCSSLTDYECVYEEVSPCDGNNVCEEGEFPWSEDCPESCDDNNICTEDTYNYEVSSCFNQDIVPCCSNNKCETGETFVNCPLDCEQKVDVKIDTYSKGQRFQDVDLTGTDYTYLTVRFKIKNIGIDKEEVFNYKKLKGFYYDPFKMRVEDGTSIFDVEYDSDYLDDWLDYAVIPKGDTRGAALLFIVPLYSENMRLVTYDRQGSRLDVDEIY
jgi:hypothetical protein